MSKPVPYKAMATSKIERQSATKAYLRLIPDPEYSNELIDFDNPPSGVVFGRTKITGNSPFDVIGGNSGWIISMAWYSNNQVLFGQQIIGSFGSSKIAIRHHGYGLSNNWSNWSIVGGGGNSYRITRAYAAQVQAA